MNKRMYRKARVNCRQARKQFRRLDERGAIAGAREQLSAQERAALERHIQACAGCASEYRLYALGLAALNLVAAPEPVRPDEGFFKALRARIARGPETISPPQQQDESWAGALLVIARQMIPAMALLLILIVGATVLWNSSSKLNKPSSASQAARSTERVNDFPEPTPDDVFESVVAVEERWDGK